MCSYYYNCIFSQHRHYYGSISRQQILPTFDLSKQVFIINFSKSCTQAGYHLITFSFGLVYALLFNYFVFIYSILINSSSLNVKEICYLLKARQAQVETWTFSYTIIDMSGHQVVHVGNIQVARIPPTQGNIT